MIRVWCLITLVLLLPAANSYAELPQSGIWISAVEVMQLDTQGEAWQSVVDWAN